MNELLINRTAETPEINFNPVSGVLKISGRAYSNDINLFYKKLELWLDEYLISPCETTTIEYQIDYCNSIFHKLLLIFFEKSKSLIQKDKKLIIRWHYLKDDVDCMDDADRISKIIKFPIALIEFE